MQLGLLAEGDWFGIVTMAVGLASLQAVLEEGNKDDWFGSPFIVKLAIVAAVSLALFIANELIVEKPLLRLRLLTQRSFGLGTISSIFLGFALFGTVYLLPAYLGQVQGYNAEQIGTVLAWTGLPQLLLIPLVPKLMQRFDIRYIAFAGLALFALSAFMNIEMSLDYSGDQRKLYAFALVDAHSRMLYVEFTHSQSFDTFVRCHIHAFTALGGVSREIFYDNLATAVAEHDGKLIRFLPRFLAFARECNFYPRACNPASGWEKGKVERAIGYLRQNFVSFRETCVTPRSPSC